MINKIGIIGGGNIGGVLVHEIVSRRLARNVGLVDVKPPEFAAGKCLDIAEATPVFASDVNCEGSKTYEVLEGADFVINTAGVPRTMRADGTFPSREELLAINLKITDAVAAGIKQYAPNAFVISIANPLDAIVYRLFKKLKHDPKRIMGMAGVLDSARYKYFVAKEANVSVENVEAVVLGGHGDTMVPIRSACRIYGLPVEQFVPKAKLEKIEARTRGAGGEVVKLLGSRLGLRLAGGQRPGDGRGHRLRQAQDHAGGRLPAGRVRRQGPVRGRARHPGQERHRGDHQDQADPRREEGAGQLGQRGQGHRGRGGQGEVGAAAQSANARDRRSRGAGGPFSPVAAGISQVRDS